ncbi:hypothetical protein ND973_20435 [Vibrio diabolicus]|uniref:hypothetical protein n=1 Tax=Vibrio diabolicus TaxID=50719 RepID=UPI00215B7EDA|nr:hypothetical protein [Vibrio diabolicus]MCR9473861.1 hypothetical protein [Vibrio diabolicus]MCS0329460.1 hypothetical protein [Vibrio diabolicus]
MNFTNLNFLGITKNYEFLTQTFTKIKTGTLLTVTPKNKAKTDKNTTKVSAKIFSISIILFTNNSIDIKKPASTGE